MRLAGTVMLTKPGRDATYPPSTRCAPEPFGNGWAASHSRFPLGAGREPHEPHPYSSSQSELHRALQARHQPTPRRFWRVRPCARVRAWHSRHLVRAPRLRRGSSSTAPWSVAQRCCSSGFAPRGTVHSINVVRPLNQPPTCASCQAQGLCCKPFARLPQHAVASPSTLGCKERPQAAAAGTTELPGGSLQAIRASICGSMRAAHHRGGP
jgi:hypothetical protein